MVGEAFLGQQPGVFFAGWASEEEDARCRSRAIR